MTTAPAMAGAPYSLPLQLFASRGSTGPSRGRTHPARYPARDMGRDGLEPEMPRALVSNAPDYLRKFSDETMPK
jgi:hypothetical protein